MTTIPASEIVAVVPSVLGVGGSSLDVIALMLTNNTRPPIGQVLSFADAPSVEDFFGPDTIEADAATKYFAGFIGANKLPEALLFAQYPFDDVAAYLRGGDISAISLATLQSYSGAFSVTIDGVVKSGNVDLAAATSFSNAGQIISDALNIEGAEAASFTGSISGTTLTVSSVASGTLAVGQLIDGTGVTDGTYISALGSGTGGTGTYTVSPSQTAISAPMTAGTPGVAYDSVSGAFVVSSGSVGDDSSIGYASGALATSLLLTAATGAVLSQGADAITTGTVGAFMNGIIAVNSDWVTYMTTFDPDESGNDFKQAFAEWKNTALGGNRFGYVCWDLDVTPTTTLPATSSLGYILANNNDSGTFLLDGDPANGWDLTAAVELAAFVCGTAASIDFTQARGRITFAGKGQSGIDGTVVSSTIANNLGGSPQSSSRGNGYNFYGAYGAAAENFIWLQRGFVTGPWKWFDGYINQIWLNNSFQIDELTLVQNSKSIPYDVTGYSMIEAALADTIQQALEFGAFGPGPLTAAQAAQVNASARTSIAKNIESLGYYLQVKPATPAIRAARTSPPITFWYLDNGSIQALNISSVALI